jgi:hypothetical protein
VDWSQHQNPRWRLTTTPKGSSSRQPSGSVPTSTRGERDLRTRLILAEPRLPKIPGQKRAGMQNRSNHQLCRLCCSILLLSAIAEASGPVFGADGCPTVADEIVTDRPDVTNSSLVVPWGSVQAENGVDWSVRHGSDSVDGTNTRLRLGVAHCTEFLIDVPNYFGALNGDSRPGFRMLSFLSNGSLRFRWVWSYRQRRASGFPPAPGISRARAINRTSSSPGLTASQMFGKWRECLLSAGFRVSQSEIQLLSRPWRSNGNLERPPTCSLSTSGITSITGLIKSSTAAAPGVSPRPSSSIFTPASV